MSFLKMNMDKKNYATNILNLPATGAIVQAELKALLVISDWHMKLKEVKQLGYLMIKEKTFIEPSVASKDKTYPIARPLFYMFNKKMLQK
jgi:phosphate transport system substrate-binding protein